MFNYIVYLTLSLRCIFKDLCLISSRLQTYKARGWNNICRTYKLMIW